MHFFKYASAGATLMDAFIVMAITFAVLIALFLLMKIFTFVFSLFKQKQSSAVNEADSIEDEQTESRYGGEFSAGRLILKDVDQPTAAMIMAIVSDQSGIPLEHLIFRSIKLVK